MGSRSEIGCFVNVMNRGFLLYVKIDRKAILNKIIQYKVFVFVLIVGRQNELKQFTL
jgi:hypothetical protein